MRRTWRNLFYFSKADRRAVLLLAGVLMGIVLSTSFFLWFDRRTPAKEDSGDSLVYERFFAGLKPDTVVVVRSGPTYGQPVKAKPATFFFDPNTADSTALLRLGLSPWQVRNIYKYRARGGRYHRPEDFSKLYGLTKGDYERLLPYIRIADKYKLMSDLYPHGLPGTDTVELPPRQEKFPEGIRVELNTADTATLKKIPGIGSYYARRIVDYRNRLGGFVSVAQLKEMGELPENIGRWFTVSPAVHRPLLVNRMSVEVLRCHPYLNFYQSRVIVEHRRKYVPIKKLQALSLYEEFSPSDLERLQPYVSFEE